MQKLKFSAGALGLAGVALGAFGAHALKPVLAARGTAGLWEKAVFYQLVHAVAILAMAIAAEHRRGDSPARPWPVRAAACWIAGTVCFSGSLYLLALGAPIRWLWPVTPLGGLLFLLGWGGVILDSLRASLPQKTEN